MNNRHKICFFLLFAIMSAFTIKKMNKVEQIDWSVIKIVGYAGGTDPKDYDALPAEARLLTHVTPEPNAEDLDEQHCPENSPMCLAVVRYQDNNPVVLVAVLTGVYQ